MKRGGREYTNHFWIKFNQTIIKIIHPFFWSQTQHHGSNDVNKVHDQNFNPRSARIYIQKNKIIFKIKEKSF